MADPSPKQTLAVLLGASWYDLAPKLAQGLVFANSAHDFREYLLAPAGQTGMGLPRENISWLFDDTRSPSDQLRAVGDFLERRSSELSIAGNPPSDLIVFYVGHGLFSGPEQAYHFAVRGTEERREGLTSIRASELAMTIKDRARFLRKFLVLDCCFSAAIYREFQSGPLQAGRQKLLNELPHRGTTLLCSASAQDASLAPEGLTHTMFSDSLLRALRRGHPTLGPRLSFNELGDLIKLDLLESFPNWVRPEVHSPDQREGDVASVGLFPNRSYVAERRERPEPTVAAPNVRRAETRRVETPYAIEPGPIGPEPIGIAMGSTTPAQSPQSGMRAESSDPGYVSKWKTGTSQLLDATSKPRVAVALGVPLLVGFSASGGLWTQISGAILCLLAGGLLLQRYFLQRHFASKAQWDWRFLALCLTLGLCGLFVPTQLQQFQGTGAILLGAVLLEAVIGSSSARPRRRWPAYASLVQSALIAFCVGGLALVLPALSRGGTVNPSPFWIASCIFAVMVWLVIALGTLIAGPRTWAALSITTLPIVTTVVTLLAAGLLPPFSPAFAYLGSITTIAFAYRFVSATLGDGAMRRPSPWILRQWWVIVAILAFMLCSVSPLFGVD
jgi:hypothetical protein